MWCCVYENAVAAAAFRCRPVTWQSSVTTSEWKPMTVGSMSRAPFGSGNVKRQPKLLLSCKNLLLSGKNLCEGEEGARESRRLIGNKGT